MKIKIQSAKDFRLPTYNIESGSLSQPFQQTDIKWLGTFGNIQLIKTDLQDCCVALINYKLDLPVTIQIHLDKIVYQVSFNFSPIESRTGKAVVLLSKADTIELPLPALSGQLLLIHYTTGYFNKDGTTSELSPLFQANTFPGKTSIPLTAASLSTLQQVINSSTTSKMCHLTLQDKTAELLRMLWESTQQERPPACLSGKEIEIAMKVKELISGDLSKTHTKFSLSKLVGGDAYSLSKNFKEWFGISLRQYIHISRMEKARELLRHSDLAIKKITFVVGYKNVSNFSESFKSYYGYSPSHLRESGNFPDNP